MDTVQVHAAQEGAEESHHICCELQTPHTAPGAGTAAWLGETDRVNREGPQICIVKFKPPLCSDPPPCHVHTPFIPCKEKARSPEATARVPFSRLHTRKLHGYTHTFSRAVFPAARNAERGALSPPPAAPRALTPLLLWGHRERQRPGRENAITRVFTQPKNCSEHIFWRSQALTHHREQQYSGTGYLLISVSQLLPRGLAAASAHCGSFVSGAHRGSRAAARCGSLLGSGPSARRDRAEKGKKHRDHQPALFSPAPGRALQTIAGKARRDGERRARKQQPPFPPAPPSRTAAAPPCVTRRVPQRPPPPSCAHSPAATRGSASPRPSEPPRPAPPAPARPRCSVRYPALRMGKGDLLSKRLMNSISVYICSK